MAEGVHALRHVTDTLSSSSRHQLSRVIPSLVDQVSSIGEILCGRIQTPASIPALVHKFKTQISSLLQDKTVQGRWTAVVLIKTVLEAVIQHQEGWDFLQTVGSWVRGLLATIGKPDPVATKTMVLLLLTRIFLLTHGKSTLTREITTPNLAPFITACLNLLLRRTPGKELRTTEISSPFLETILQSFIRLLPNHPAGFRPFNSQIRNLLRPLLAPTPSNLAAQEVENSDSPNQRITRLAQALHALLPGTAPKNGAGEEWKKSVHLIVKHINRTANVTLRSVHGSRIQVNGNANLDSEEQPTDEVDDELRLPPWRGIKAGVERLIGLLSLLVAYLGTKNAGNCQIPVKTIYETIDRLLSISRPSALTNGGVEQINKQISKEERETVYMLLPSIHLFAIEILSVLLRRMPLLSNDLAEDALEQVSWMASRSTMPIRLRASIYSIIARILQDIGPSLQIDKAASTNPILRMACKELLPLEAKSVVSSTTTKTNGHTTQYNADTFLTGSKSMATKTSRHSPVQSQALKLLRVAMQRLPASTLTKVRLEEIDKVAVLLQDTDLQLASILNPQKSSPRNNVNLVPFAAQSEDFVVDALLQRRMVPVAHRIQETEEEPPSDHENEQTSNVGEILQPFVSVGIPLNEELPEVSLPQATTRPNSVTTVPVSTSTIPVKRAVDPALDNPEEQGLSKTSSDFKKARIDSTTNDGPAVPLTTSVAAATTEAPHLQEQQVIQETEMLDVPDAGSDSSFEVPEIFVDTDDDEEEGEANADD